MEDMLIFSYISDEHILNSLSYNDIDNGIRYGVSLNKHLKHAFLVWDVFFDYNTNDNTNHIVTRNITAFNLERLRTVKEEVISTIVYNEDKDTNGVFTVTLSIDNKKVDLMFDYTKAILLISTDTYSIARVQDIKSGEHEAIYYLDKDIFVIYNKKEKFETLVKDGIEVKYEFNHDKLDITNYLLFHRPFRVTNYTENKQYILEYDNFGLVKSMIDISNTNKNLCEYSSHIDSKFKKIVSVHPNLYNEFNIKNSLKGYTKECCFNLGDNITHTIENSDKKKQ